MCVCSVVVEGVGGAVTVSPAHLRSPDWRPRWEGGSAPEGGLVPSGHGPSTGSSLGWWVHRRLHFGRSGGRSLQFHLLCCLLGKFHNKERFKVPNSRLPITSARQMQVLAETDSSLMAFLKSPKFSRADMWSTRKPRSQPTSGQEAEGQQVAATRGRSVRQGRLGGAAHKPPEHPCPVLAGPPVR